LSNGGRAGVLSHARTTVSCGFMTFALHNLRALAVEALAKEHELVSAFDAMCPGIRTVRKVFAH
jgi:hypothetical protein